MCYYYPASRRLNVNELSSFITFYHSLLFQMRDVADNRFIETVFLH